MRERFKIPAGSDGQNRIPEADCAAIEEFNRDVDDLGEERLQAAFAAAAGNMRSSRGTDENPAEEKILAVYAAADSLSLANAKEYRIVLALLAAAATVVTMAFLLYDEAELYWMILVCGVMILCLFLTNHIAKRLGCHKKYLEYRVLAECLRVQYFLYVSGVRFQAVDVLPWTIQKNTPWIRSALEAVMENTEPGPGQSVLHCWIEGQLEYHRAARKKILRQSVLPDRIVKAAVILSIAFYLSALFFEIRFAGLLGGSAVMPGENADHVRTVLKVLLGGLSAATLFAGDYFGKLSLQNTANDHQRMILLYEKVKDEIRRDGETEKLLRWLAREELNENSSWYAYQSVNTPEIGL